MACLSYILYDFSIDVPSNIFLDWTTSFRFIGVLVDDYFTPFVANSISSFNPWFQSLILDGIIAGVGGIIVLLPIILSLFTCITILEDSGYMARVAFLMDKIMRKIGLSGKAFIL